MICKGLFFVLSYFEATLLSLATTRHRLGIICMALVRPNLGPDPTLTEYTPPSRFFQNTPRARTLSTMHILVSSRLQSHPGQSCPLAGFEHGNA